MRSILVVDDEPNIRGMMAEVLMLEGYSVQTAEHGGPALDILRTSPEHLLVTLGLVMPEVDGWAVLEAVAADAELAQRHVIIMVTGNYTAATEGRIQELREALDVPVIPKPFTVEQLLDAVADAERRWSARYGDRQNGQEP